MVTSVSDLKDKLKTCCSKGQYQAPKKLHCKIQSIFLLQYYYIILEPAAQAHNKIY